MDPEPLRFRDDPDRDFDAEIDERLATMEGQFPDHLLARMLDTVAHLRANPGSGQITMAYLKHAAAHPDRVFGHRRYHQQKILDGDFGHDDRPPPIRCSCGALTGDVIVGWDFNRTEYHHGVCGECGRTWARLPETVDEPDHEGVY